MGGSVSLLPGMGTYFDVVLFRRKRDGVPYHCVPLEINSVFFSIHFMPRDRYHSSHAAEGLYRPRRSQEMSAVRGWGIAYGLFLRGGFTDFVLH